MSESRDPGEAPPQLVSPGTIVAGRYQVLEAVGQGGMGVVCLAEDLKLRCRVALKVAVPPWNAFEQHRARFQREARIGAVLGQHSEGFVRALDWGELEPGRSLYLVMDYVERATPLDLEGGTLEERLTRLAKAAALVARVHECGIVHRDIKPDNVLVSANGWMHVADFGVAKELEPARRVERPAEPPRLETDTGHVMGTPTFMPPEQFDESRAVGTRADVYALGVMLFFCLVRRYPYPGSNAMRVIAQQLEVRFGREPPPSPRRHDPSIDARLDQLCQDALALEPERRPDAATFAAALVKLVHGGPTDPARDAVRGRRPLRAELRIDAQGLATRQSLWKVRKELGAEAFRRMVGSVLALRIKEERPLQGVDGSALLDRVAFLLPRQERPGLGPVTLGRHAECDIVIALTSISKRQVRFEPRGDAWVAVEEGSRNGTTLNGVALPAGAEQLLADADELCLSAHLVLDVLSAGRLVEWLEERAGWRRR